MYFMFNYDRKMLLETHQCPFCFTREETQKSGAKVWIFIQVPQDYGCSIEEKGESNCNLTQVHPEREPIFRTALHYESTSTLIELRLREKPKPAHTVVHNPVLPLPSTSARIEIKANWHVTFVAPVEAVSTKSQIQAKIPARCSCWPLSKTWTWNPNARQNEILRSQ